MVSENGMRRLAAAVVERAISDWNKADELLRGNPDYMQAQETQREIEHFFKGSWFGLLCEINPDFTKIHLGGKR